MKQPPVSVTIAAYNAEKWIEQCLNSVFAQTYPQELIEIVVVDDGSTDKTKEILQGLAGGHRNLRILSQENKGTAATHTIGLKNCQGKYIFVLSHDCRCCAFYLGSTPDSYSVRQTRGRPESIPRSKYIFADKNRYVRSNCHNFCQQCYLFSSDNSDVFTPYYKIYCFSAKYCAAERALV